MVMLFMATLSFAGMVCGCITMLLTGGIEATGFNYAVIGAAVVLLMFWAILCEMAYKAHQTHRHKQGRSG